MRPLPAALPTADAALALIKPRVRAQAAYALQAPEARRKLNQNESPFDVPALIAAAAAAAARVVVVNSPNNPTGTPFPEGEGGGVARLLAETEALIVVDEAYQDFGGPTAIPLLAQHPRLVVLRTFSKAMSLAGLRFGYALAHPAVAREIAKAKLPYNVNRVTLAAAHAALDARDVFAEATARIRDARDRLLRRLRE